MVLDETSSVNILPRRSSPEGSLLILQGVEKVPAVWEGSRRLPRPGNGPEQAEIGGEADGVEVVSFQHGFASGRAKSLVVAVEGVRYAISQAFLVEKVHQLTVFSVADYLLDW